MVRAAGLYPAGSRFESWLPYHRHSHVRDVVRSVGPLSRRAVGQAPGLVPDRAARRQTIVWICSTRSARRSVVMARAGGSDANHAGTWSGVTTAQAGVRRTDGSAVTTAA